MVAVEHFVGNLRDICNLKLEMQVDKQKGLVYVITLKSYMDNKKLQSKLSKISLDKRTIDRSYDYINIKLRNIEQKVSEFDDVETARIITSLFTNYCELIIRSLQEQIHLSKEYSTIARSVDVLSESDVDMLVEMNTSIDKLKRRMESLISEIKTTWSSNYIEYKNEVDVVSEV